MNALTFNNVVVQVSKNTFEVAPGLVWYACGEDVQPGWIKSENNTFAPAQIALTWDQVRAQRDILLTETDWVVIKAQETGQSVSRAWLEYREALRNITLQPNLQNINWPVKPS